MGQGQSSADSAADAPAQDSVLKTDYYELLEVERTVTDDELKRAYRRKALELHPDRNYGNVEQATTLFAEVQTAYEVLSDPQERAWYDSHRDVLLRGETVGGQHGEEYSYNVKMTTTDEVLKLMLKFNGRLDFSDSPSGFYGGLNDFFQKLAKEEDIACQWEDLDPLEYPEFGAKDDDYDDVIKPFYGAWSGFATRKSYSWKDQYRLSDAPDRRIRRLMEKENKKLRDDAIQEFNDAVRSLVAFVRKRDPRIRVNQKSEAERQKTLREAAAAQAARARAHRQARNQELENFVVPEWAQSRTNDEHEGGFSSESDVEEHEYECVACNKTFKSEAQYKAHERSKKHLKSLKQLQREMRAEGKELNLDTKGTGDDSQHDENGTASETESLGEVNDVAGVERDDATSIIETDDEEKHAWQPTARSAVHGQAAAQDQNPHNHSDDKDEDDEEKDTSSEDAEDSDYAPRSQIESRLVDSYEKLYSALDRTTITDQIDVPSADDPSVDGMSTPQLSDSTSQSAPKLGKAKQKRAKKLAATAAANSNGDRTTGGELSCAVCGAEFTSKNRLFDHIKEKNHAAPIAQTKNSNNAKTGKKKRK